MAQARKRSRNRYRQWANPGGGRNLPPQRAAPTSVPSLPARVHPPRQPTKTLAPHPGRQAWTCRAGFETHLFEELAWAGAHPTLLGEAFVESAPLPGLRPTFGRMGFKVAEAIEGLQEVDRIARAVRSLAAGRPIHLQAWTLDTPRANPLSGETESLRQQVLARLEGIVLLESASLAQQRDGLLAQLCVVPEALVVVGGVPATQAVSLAPGGRMRMRRGGAAPSRAAAKLEEALETLGLEPSPGETCVDLGAAPGGWTQRLVARGASVIAVDPARLAPELESHRKVHHVQESAFAFSPEAPVDWLFCDMAWRPLEVAQLLAKWGRRGWALHLVANIKLPMKDKNPVLYRVRETLTAEGGWKHLSLRQLYHDRDEVTVTARRA